MDLKVKRLHCTVSTMHVVNTLTALMLLEPGSETDPVPDYRNVDLSKMMRIRNNNYCTVL
jgi:hypothetical protein